jgi:phosphonopyruvate decarboxylase
MINPKDFYNLIVNKTGHDFFCGVPDSTLKYLCTYIDENSKNHFITANEGSAISMGIGHHLATGEVPFVYMQNSGIGNSLNPILSMASKEIYQIPMIIFVGWRGENRDKDEPQHKHQGKVMIPAFGAMEIDYDIMPTNLKSVETLIDQVLNKIKFEPKPYYIIIKPGTFEEYTPLVKDEDPLSLSREFAINKIIKSNEDAYFLATTGFTGRELFELQDDHSKSFLSIGGMGHVSSIAMGIANSKKDKSIITLDGDGSLLMHMGNMAIAGQSNLKNFIHIVFNNGCHHSVGGQKTVAKEIDLIQISKACGYKKSIKVSNETELNLFVDQIPNLEGPIFCEILINKSMRSDLGRPTLSPKEIKKLFMEKLNG